MARKVRIPTPAIELAILEDVRFWYPELPTTAKLVEVNLHSWPFKSVWVEMDEVAAKDFAVKAPSLLWENVPTSKNATQS